MKQFNFNSGWSYRKAGEPVSVSVTLPHDAQISEKRDKSAAGGSGHGYFPGGIYEYEKKFTAPEEWENKTVEILFEGIYKDSKVYVNDKCIAEHKYGYTPFTVVLDGVIRYGQENIIKVVADNSRLPNSRWYSGGGIYRPVSLLVGEKAAHIRWQGVRITTLSVNPARIRVETEAVDGEAMVEILDGDTVIAAGCGNDIQLDIPDAKLWSAEHPYLYQCRVCLKKDGVISDEVTEEFGIRRISWNKNGLFINGNSTLLRGGCVHHDHGILGAACYEESEERRVRILKEAGFNAIRVSHNPASGAMLRACDRLGIYVMDETFDMWYNRKNPYDYGCDFEQCWEEDTRAMVERDYNHPSVILYSIGNEVAEPFEERGVQTGRRMVDFVHSLDAGRPVTCGVNLMIIGRAAKGNGIYQDGEQNTSSKKQEGKSNGNASLAFNIMASFIGTGMNKGGNSKKVDELTTPFLDCLDIAGYNYASGRYPLEAKAHPDRIIFGSETFPQDICRNWEMVKKFPYLVGDFMWTAWDYLGESGIGAWSYTGGMPFNRPYPWLLAGAGVIDILGIPDASCRYAAVVWGLMKKPVIGVRPVNHPGVRVSKSVWRGTNAIESWSWKNCDGNKAEIEVYADAASVALFINGKKLGQKKLKEYKAFFKTKYEPGILEAVSYDASGRETGRNSLRSAEGVRNVAVIPEKKSVRSGEIAYINIEIQGQNGVVESNDDRKLTVKVENGQLLGFGSANPCTEEEYHTGCFTSYQGRAQAVVRAGEKGKVKLTVSDGAGQYSSEIVIQG